MEGVGGRGWPYEARGGTYLGVRRLTRVSIKRGNYISLVREWVLSLLTNRDQM